MKRITFITGHYGSGKSEVSLNLAIQKSVDYLVDLDIINPYFRSREAEEELKSRGIKLISSTLKNSLGSDLPYISPESFTPFIDKTLRAVYDFGGDRVGARVMHQFKDYLNLDEVDILFCVNTFREETKCKKRIIEMIRKIETETGFKITGLINNSNLLKETKCEEIKLAQKILQLVSQKLNIPIYYTAGMKEIIKDCNNLMGEVISMNLYLRKTWM